MKNQDSRIYCQHWKVHILVDSVIMLNVEPSKALKQYMNEKTRLLNVLSTLENCHQ